MTQTDSKLIKKSELKIQTLRLFRDDHLCTKFFFHLQVTLSIWGLSFLINFKNYCELANPLFSFLCRTVGPSPKSHIMFYFPR